MIHHPPSGKSSTSWLLLTAWTAFILAIIPFARAIRNSIADSLGKESFTYFTVICALVGTLIAIRYLRRNRLNSSSSTAWIALTAFAYIGGALLLRESPIEALHFVLYGVLGLLGFRALSHHVKDPSIYVSATIIAAIVGLLDEGVQWIAPRRFWGLRDIYIDVAGAALMQVGIAKGLRPTIISWPLTASGIRWVCRLGILLALLSAITLLNTPQRIYQYSDMNPRLDFLKSNESVMLEYGYRFDDPETGPFKSRFSARTLQQTDSERGPEAAMILDQFRDHSTYEEFLTTHTPVTDAFVHEARVHLFRRDKHLEWAEETKNDPYQHLVHLTVAYKENRLMEKYFPVTLQHSDYTLAPEVLNTITEHRLPDSELPKKEVLSTVSRHLVTVVREPQILLFIGLATSLLVWIDIRFGAKARKP